MSELYEQIEKEVTEYGAEITAAFADKKISISEVIALGTSATMRVTRITQKLPATGAEKKEAALQALETIYSKYIEPIDIKPVPNIVEPFVDKTIGALIRPVFGPLIDLVVAEHKAAGTF